MPSYILSLTFIRLICRKIIVMSFFFSLVFKSLTFIFNKLWTLMPGRDAACPCCAVFIYGVSIREGN